MHGRNCRASFAIFPLIEHGGTLAIFVAIVGQLFFVSMMYGPQAALFAELFPKSVRYSGASLGYQIGAVVGGGLAPIIATALVGYFGGTAGVSVMMIGIALITLAAAIAARETKDEALF